MNAIGTTSPLRGSVTTTARLNIRRSIPDTKAAIERTVESGTDLAVTGIVRGETFAGNDSWYQGAGETYFWSGGCSRFTPDAPGETAMMVRRRADGTIAPLKLSQVEDAFGKFSYREGQKGRIAIDKRWVDPTIVKLATPILAEEGFPEIRVHRMAVDPFRRVFEKIEEQGFAERILTCAGTFVPRHKGWNLSRSLSSHSWGIAIDLNVAWNGYGRRPADLGERGSVRELVPLFEAEGFAWGGYFSSPHEDGMHFELARMDLE
jgi:hypothetical protein